MYKKFSLHLISLLVTLTLTQIHPQQLCPVLHHHLRHPHLNLYDQQHQPLRNDKCQRESYLSKLLCSLWGQIEQLRFLLLTVGWFNFFKTQIFMEKRNETMTKIMMTKSLSICWSKYFCQLRHFARLSHFRSLDQLGVILNCASFNTYMITMMKISWDWNWNWGVFWLMIYNWW